MAELIRIEGSPAIEMAATLRSDATSSQDLNWALEQLGFQVAHKLIEQFFRKPTPITTPMGIGVDTAIVSIPLCVVIATRSDANQFGRAIAAGLNGAPLGWLDFGGMSGSEALKSGARAASWPDDLRLSREPIEMLVVAKSVIATGCTAISLTRSAMSRYNPRTVAIAAVFSAQAGIDDLAAGFPHSTIFVIGPSDTLDSNGMLLPGVGNLDERLGA
ncbi:MAG: uracil phosphoribosyltransferase [Thermomicrobiales bacterium]